MGLFQRRLDGLAQLEDLASAPGPNWWKDLLALWGQSGTGFAARPLRLAIRDNYLNFYLRGQSVARVSVDRRLGPAADLHVKYAFAGATDQAYARLSAGHVEHPKTGRSSPYLGLATLLQWMVRAASWEGAEKGQVDRLVADSPSVIDLEMGLPAYGSRTGALRMDLVALERTADGLQLVFWEAKRIGDARLRARSGPPEVVAQVNAYRDYLADDDCRRAVTDAYAESCRILKRLADCAGVALSDEVVQAGQGRPLLIDPTPRLVVIGTERQLAEPRWAAQLQHLHDQGITVKSVRSDGYRLTP